MTATKTIIRQPLTLATKVTILRLLGVPVFILVLLYYGISLQTNETNEWLRVAALIIFVAVAMTDALDGYLARSRNEVTWLGRILDPLADKALVLSGIIMLSRPSIPEFQPQFPAWFTLLVISRDVVTIGGVFLIDYFTDTVQVRARLSGKIATACTMLAIAWALAALSADVFRILVWVAGGFTLSSFVGYIRDGWRQLDHRHDPVGTTDE